MFFFGFDFYCLCDYDFDCEIECKDSMRKLDFVLFCSNLGCVFILSFLVYCFMFVWDWVWIFLIVIDCNCCGILSCLLILFFFLGMRIFEII